MVSFRDSLKTCWRLIIQVSVHRELNNMSTLRWVEPIASQLSRHTVILVKVRLMWQYYVLDNPPSRFKTSRQPRSHLCLFFQAPGAKVVERPWKRSCSYRWATNCSKGAVLNYFSEYAFPIKYLACPPKFYLTLVVNFSWMLHSNREN